jgi:hypothetical protein
VVTAQSPRSQHSSGSAGMRATVPLHYARVHVGPLGLTVRLASVRRMSRPFRNDKSVGRAAQFAAPTLPIHNTAVLSRRPPPRPLDHYPTWSPLSHSTHLRRRAVSVRSFSRCSFFNSGCTGFTLGAAAAASPPATKPHHNDCGTTRPRCTQHLVPPPSCMHHDCPALQSAC